MLCGVWYLSELLHITSRQPSAATCSCRVRSQGSVCDFRNIFWTSYQFGHIWPFIWSQIFIYYLLSTWSELMFYLLSVLSEIVVHFICCRQRQKNGICFICCQVCQKNCVLFAVSVRKTMYFICCQPCQKNDVFYLLSTLSENFFFFCQLCKNCVLHLPSKSSEMVHF